MLCWETKNDLSIWTIWCDCMCVGQRNIFCAVNMIYLKEWAQELQGFNSPLDIFQRFNSLSFLVIYMYVTWRVRQRHSTAHRLESRMKNDFISMDIANVPIISECWFIFSSLVSKVFFLLFIKYKWMKKNDTF